MGSEVPVFVRIRGSKDASLNATIGQVRGDVKRLTADVVDTGSKVGTWTGAASLSLVAMGAAALSTAGKFEQLGAKLNALLKDGEAAQRQLEQAAALAASTPFSVEGIVTATVQLTAFGLRANSALRQVADLAAAMGTSVEDASLAVGKAASGSAEGFQSLRDTYGLTTAELHKLGVQLNTSGGVLLQTPAQVERARAALLTLIQTKFGGAAEAQSRTFQGAMSNVGDAVDLALNHVGKSLLGIGTTLARFTSDVIGRVQEIPAPLVAVGVAAGALTAGLLGFVSVVTLGGAALLSWYTSLEAAAATSTVAKAAVDRLSSSYATLAGAANTAATSQTRLATATRTAVAGMAIAGGIYLVASLGLKAWEDSAIKAGDAIDAASKKSVGATQRWKLYRDAINSAAQESGVMVDRGGRLADTAASIQQAFAKTSPATMVANLEKAGVNLEDLRKEVGKVGDDLDLAQKKFQDLSRLANRATSGNANPKAVLQVTGSSLEQFFPGRTAVTIEEIQTKVAQLNAEMQDLGRTKVAVESALGAFEKFAAPLQAAIDHAKTLDDYLRFTKSSKDLSTLQERLNTTNQELRTFQRSAQEQGLPTETAALQRELLTATGTRRDFVKSFLGLIEQQADAERDLASVQQAAELEKLNVLERSHQQRQAMTGSSARLERAAAQERLALVEGSVKKEQGLLKQIESVRQVKAQNPNLAGVDERLRQLQLELEGVRKLADEEIKARQTVRDANKKILEGQLTDAQKAIQDQVDAAQKLTAELKGTEGENAPVVAGQIAAILSGLDRWEAKNQVLLASSRQLRRSLQDAREAIGAQQNALREQLQTKRLDEIKQKVTIEVAEATDSVTKLQSVRGAIAQINQERKSGLLDAKAAQAALVELQKQEVSLAKQAAQEAAAKAATLAGITQSSLEKEVEHLRVRAEAGEDVANKLAVKEKELLAAKVAAIEAAAEADRAANKDREIVEAERSAKLRALLLDETNAKIQANKQANDTISSDNQSRNSNSGQSGGGLVPGMFVSPEAYSSGISTSGFSQGRQIRRKVSVPTPDQVAGQIGLSSAAKARYDKLSSQGFQVPAPLSKEDAGGVTQSVNDQARKSKNQVVNDNRQFTLQVALEGGSIDTVLASPRLRDAVVGFVEEKHRNEGYRDGGASWA